MKILLIASALVSVACAGIAPIIIIPSSAIVRGNPDSAIVQSERSGGGFAYSFAEGHGIEPISGQLRLTSLNNLPLISTLGSQSILLPPLVIENTSTKEKEIVSSTTPSVRSTQSSLSTTVTSTDVSLLSAKTTEVPETEPVEETTSIKIQSVDKIKVEDNVESEKASDN